MGAKHPGVVGILGGMGPEATIWLMRRILAFTPARDDSGHVPLLVDNNTQVPSRIKAIIEGDGEDPAPVLCAMAQKLEACGAKALAMPCNTAHYYAPVIAQCIGIPLLNMVDLTAAEAVALRTHNGRPVRRVGMIASPAVRLTGVFDQSFAKVAIEEAGYPTDNHRILDCIKALKAGRNNEQTLVVLNEVAAALQAEGADAIVVACSELSLLADQIDVSIPIVDSIDVLARAVIDFSMNPGAA